LNAVHKKKLISSFSKIDQGGYKERDIRNCKKIRGGYRGSIKERDKHKKM